METALYVSNLFKTVLDIKEFQAKMALRIGFSENFKKLCWELPGILFFIYIDMLTLPAPTPQNDQTHSVRRKFPDELSELWVWRLKG